MRFKGALLLNLCLHSNRTYLFNRLHVSRDCSRLTRQQQTASSKQHHNSNGSFGSNGSERSQGNILKANTDSPGACVSCCVKERTSCERDGYSCGCSTFDNVSAVLRYFLWNPGDASSLFKSEELEPIATPFLQPLVPLVACGLALSVVWLSCWPRPLFVLLLLDEGKKEGIVNFKGRLFSSRGYGVRGPTSL